MTRYAKLTIAALVTTLAATFGTAGVVASVDAGKSIQMKKDGNWCC